MFEITSLTGKIDLHMHTTFSDGTDTPAQILKNVKSAGIGVFSITDHDAVNANNIISGLLRDGDPIFIPGVEFSCKDENGKYHILGYGFDPNNDEVQKVVDYGHALRVKKLKARLSYLKTEYGFNFSEEDLEKLFSLNNPGKPHIGNLMVKYGFADTKESAINNYINCIHFTSEYVRPEEAISGITAGGGIPVLAHPFYGSGDELIIGEDMEKRLCKLIKYGLRGIEAYYSGFSVKLNNEALSLAERYDLFVTAGSDYHGENKLVKLGDTGLCSETVYPEKLRLFLELF